METGVNIKDDRFQYCYINDFDRTTQIQARGRIRNNIEYLYIITNVKDTEKSDREDTEVVDERNTLELQIIRKYCNRKLFTQDKNLLCEELHKYDAKGRLVKWTKISRIIKALGFEITPIRVKDKRCDIITEPTKDE